MVLRRSRLPAEEVYVLLSNARRRRAVERLCTGEDAIEVSNLAESIAAAEADERPPPAPVRESVYASLHQTHLPRLDEAGVVEYDPDRKEVRPRDCARRVGRYLNLVGPAGVPWDDFYRGLSTVGLFGVVGAAVGLPAVSAVGPLAWASGTLAVIAVATLYQLWQLRSGRRLLSRSG